MLFQTSLAGRQDADRRCIRTVRIWLTTTLTLAALFSASMLDAQESAPKEDKKENIQSRISARYSNPVFLRFAEQLTGNRALVMYREVSRLIDTRHLEPASYAKRSRQALVNLSYAAGNPDFQRANRIQPTERNVRLFRTAVQQIHDSKPMRDDNDVLQQIYQTVHAGQRYLNLQPKAVILEYAFGATRSLDQYSTFVPDRVAYGPGANLEDSIVGIGVEMKPHDLGAEVTRVLPGGPAESGRLQAGDLIISVDGHNLAGATVGHIADRILGGIGTPVKLGIQRGAWSTQTVTLIRQRVEIHHVRDAKLLSGTSGAGYIRIDRFSKNTKKDLEEAMWKLHRQGMKSLVIDLRGNPGGLLDVAIEMSNMFLPCGAIVSTRGRTTADLMNESASYEKTWKVPLVVLVDENSASASEIFAAAIQENGRGLVVGRTTYGKGTVQTHFPLDAVSGSLKLTTAKFYSPNGREMAGAGVMPDVKVEEKAAEPGDLRNDPALKAATSLAVSDRLANLSLTAAKCRTTYPSVRLPLHN